MNKSQFLALEKQKSQIISPITSHFKDLVHDFEQGYVPIENFPQPINQKRKHNDFEHAPGSKRRFSNHSNMAETTVGLRELAKKIGKAPLTWEGKPKHVMIVSKIMDKSLVQTTVDVAKWLNSLGLTVYIQDEILKQHGGFHCVSQVFDESKLKVWSSGDNKTPELIDFVITLGGDGTVLFASWLFQHKTPPIVPFNSGSLGFLTVFDMADFESTIETIISNEQGMRMNFRMRFQCTVHRAIGENGVRPDDHGSSFHVINDLVVDRGPSPFLSQLELFGNNCHLTTVQADGLVIATPTGSTAYSLSAGGSVVHPEVSAILVTPICPHTLSFRPMILPDTMDIRILVPNESRANAWVSFDGRYRINLNAGDSIQIVSSPYPIPTLCKVDQNEDWFGGLETCLAWNKREKQKALEN